MPHDVAHLVTAARDGDRAAFDELVRVTYAETFTLTLRLTGNEEDARDVVQEAYIRAFRGLSRFHGGRAVLDVDVPDHRRTPRTRTSSSAASTATRSSTTPTRSPTTGPPRARSSRPTPPPCEIESPSPWRTCPPSSARWWCCETSTTCPTRRSRPSSGCPETTEAKVRLHRARKKLREDLFPRRLEEAADAV